MPPMRTSTASRGFGADEVRRIAHLVLRVLSNIGDKNTYKEVRQEVGELSARFPVPGLSA